MCQDGIEGKTRAAYLHKSRSRLLFRRFGLSAFFFLSVNFFEKRLGHWFGSTSFSVWEYKPKYDLIRPRFCFPFIRHVEVTGTPESLRFWYTQVYRTQFTEVWRIRKAWTKAHSYGPLAGTWRAGTVPGRQKLADGIFGNQVSNHVIDFDQHQWRWSSF